MVTICIKIFINTPGRSIIVYIVNTIYNIFILFKDKYKSFLNTFKYGTKLG